MTCMNINILFILLYIINYIPCTYISDESCKCKGACVRCACKSSKKYCTDECKCNRWKCRNKVQKGHAICNIKIFLNLPVTSLSPTGLSVHHSVCHTFLCTQY